MISRSSLVVALVLVACTWPPKPEPMPDPNPAPNDLCSAVCVHEHALGCSAAKGSPGPDDVYGTIDDVPCATACHDQLAADATLEALLVCITRSENCADVDRCSASTP